MSGPIYSAIEILRNALVAALQPLTTRRVYWVEPNGSAELPYVVGQSQDGGGAAVDYVNAVDWSGLLTLRALATTLPAAEQLLRDVTPGMAALSHAGVSFAIKYQRPLTLPPVDGVYQAAHIWRISISAA